MTLHIFVWRAMERIRRHGRFHILHPIWDKSLNLLSFCLFLEQIGLFIGQQPILSGHPTTYPNRVGFGHLQTKPIQHRWLLQTDQTDLGQSLGSVFCFIHDRRRIAVALMKQSKPPEKKKLQRRRSKPPKKKKLQRRRFKPPAIQPPAKRSKLKKKLQRSKPPAKRSKSKKKSHRRSKEGEATQSSLPLNCLRRCRQIATVLISSNLQWKEREAAQ